MNTPRVLLFDAASSLTPRVSDRLQQRGFSAAKVDPAEMLRPGVAPDASDLALVLVAPDASDEQSQQLAAVLRRLVADNIATVVCGGPASLRRAGGPLVEWLDADVTADEVVGKIGTLARYVPIVNGLERELRNLQRLGEQLNRYFGEIDQEMRLAGRLQRDFLPRELPSIEGYRFDVFYRPASWVSGDMYDVFRIDEQHVGMFVADAMGHGVAAGLLTMFLRQALIAKRIERDGYSIVGPAEALDNLHQCLLRQNLPNSQFVTAAYGIVNIHTGRFTVARAGHPYPLHINAAGEIAEARPGGSLLGLADVPAEFEETTVKLTPGDKIVYYTDGVEEAMVTPGATAGDGSGFTGRLRHWAGLPAADFVRGVGDYLDCREGSLHPADDVTVLLMEVE